MDIVYLSLAYIFTLLSRIDYTININREAIEVNLRLPLARLFGQQNREENQNTETESVVTPRPSCVYGVRCYR